MEKELIGIVVSQGVWACLFLFLLFYVLKRNDKREDEYQETIKDLTGICTITQDIQRDVTDIKNMLK